MISWREFTSYLTCHLTVKYLRRNHLSQIIDPDEYDIAAGAESMHGQPFTSGGDDQFQGHKDDPESGLHYNIARSYNPMIARWTTPDPLSGNAYVPLSRRSPIHDAPKDADTDLILF